MFDIKQIAILYQTVNIFSALQKTSDILNRM